MTAGGQAGAGTERGRGRLDTHQRRHPRSQDWACKGLKPKGGNLGRSWGAQACRGWGGA